MSRSSEEDQENLKNGNSPWQPEAPRKVRFGDYEVDFAQRELRHRGARVKIQNKPFQILELLLERPGAVVTRTQLAHRLWPDSHVSFGPGLNTAMNSLREALGDSPSASRFIETRSGFGYQFVGTVEDMDGARRNSQATHLSAIRQSVASTSGAQQDYLKGKYLQRKMTDADLGKSIAHFQSAIEQDGRHALAYTGRGETYTLLALAGIMPASEARRRAEESTRIALQVDGELAAAHAALATIRTLFDWNHREAERIYNHALQLEPACADGHRQYATFLSAMGRTAEALREIQQARELDPLSLAAHVEAAQCYFMSRDFETCIRQAWQALVLEPQFAPAQHLLGLAYEQMEMYDEALIELENARECSGGNPKIVAALAHAFARIGRRDAAWQVISQLDALPLGRRTSHYWKSIAYVGLGANDLALHSIEEACQEHDVHLLWLLVEPRLAPICAEKRFTQVLEKVGLGANS